ncbi:odorant receptor 49b-like [Asbolus verrucosus]|uniref:Odorant receptor 49b-like n=1 Tax=Asbolus verrucosus TaxID=1661398 RepID=A0A482VGL1_ASBVE|nr:odorant receptor 49b-like [Asbolus verrucosus]
MEKFNWKFTIRINILMLQFLGLWPKGDEIYKHDLYMLYAVISTILIMGGHNFFQTMNIFFVYNDLEALAATIFITVTDLLVSLKMYFFVRNIGTLKKLMIKLNMVGIWLLAAANVNTDTLIAALMMYIATQCDILCDDLKNLCQDFDRKLINCVKHHRDIVRFANNSNKFFSMIVLGQFFTSTVVIALTMFQLTLVDPLSSASVSHLIYVTAITSQIFLYCWFGNEIEIKVCNLSTTVKLS